MDGALRRLSESHARNATHVGALADAIERDIGGLMERLTPREIVLSEPRGDQMRDNVVVLPAASPKALPIDANPEPARIDWSAQNPLEISLQPIIAISTGAVAGFEVFARLTRIDGSETEIQRLPGGFAMDEVARFERSLVHAAIAASRRQFGVRGLPLHVALSEALLTDSSAVTEIADLFRLHPAISRSVVLSLPIGVCLGASRAALDGLSTLANAGTVFAAEGWSGDHDQLPRLHDMGVAVLKLDAGRMLEEAAPDSTSPGSGELVQAAETAGLTVIASGVATDEDAIGLIDRGVDLMVGARFSGTRRLRSPVEASTSVSQAVGL